MKSISLLGILIVLTFTNLSAKYTASPFHTKTNIILSDTTDSTIIVIPNVFSPNNDGYNDRFKITGFFTKLDMKIYNRYGELIFKSIQLNEGWNGRTTAGIECIEGTYFYIIETDSETFTGSLTLLR